MSLNKGNKQAAYNDALDITKAYGHCGDPKTTPAIMLKELYDTIQKIKEEIVKTD